MCHWQGHTQMRTRAGHAAAPADISVLYGMGADDIAAFDSQWGAQRAGLPFGASHDDPVMMHPHASLLDVVFGGSFPAHAGGGYRSPALQAAPAASLFGAAPFRRGGQGSLADVDLRPPGARTRCEGMTWQRMPFLTLSTTGCCRCLHAV
jgi:hypothetical protein